MKINLKRITCIILAIMILNCMFGTLMSFGTSFSSKMLGEVTTVDGKNDNTGATGKVESVLAVIITIVRIAGVCIAITMLLAVAMKYMTAAAGEKADIKKSAVQYVVGAIVLFGVVGILGIIDKFAQNIKGNS